MELNQKQQEGLKIAVDRHHRGEKYTVIAGFASFDKTFFGQIQLNSIKNFSYNISKYNYMKRRNKKW